MDDFLPAQVDWVTYTEKLSSYFEANSITDTNRKKAVLLSVTGTETFSSLKDLITRDRLRNKAFDEQYHLPLIVVPGSGPTLLG